ncbi:MAG TPA: hypothetical protein DCX07_15320 [Phycisphaerales bacterium]|nr:hypothetical protein [Phycisphaerales bacterium]
MSERKATVLLEHCLKQLKLPTILREYAAVAAVCGKENQPFQTFLLQLCERELIERQQRATERRIKAAAFPTFKTIESFDFAQQPGINEGLIRELLVGEFIDRNENGGVEFEPSLGLVFGLKEMAGRAAAAVGGEGSVGSSQIPLPIPRHGVRIVLGIRASHACESHRHPGVPDGPAAEARPVRRGLRGLAAPEGRSLHHPRVRCGGRHGDRPARLGRGQGHAGGDQAAQERRGRRLD